MISCWTGLVHGCLSCVHAPSPRPLTSSHSMSWWGSWGDGHADARGKVPRVGICLQQVEAFFGHPCSVADLDGAKTVQQLLLRFLWDIDCSYYTTTPIAKGMFSFMTDCTIWLTIVHSGHSGEALGTNPDLVTASLAGMLDVYSSGAGYRQISKHQPRCYPPASCAILKFITTYP